MSAPLTFILAAALLLSLPSSAQPEHELLETAYQQEASLNEIGALETLKVAVKVNPSSYAALWKLSELCSRIGKRQTRKEHQVEIYKLGKAYALRAVSVNPAGADGYYALGLAIGRLGMMESGRERVQAVKEIRSNIEKALQLNPAHGRAWHVLGKWHYEVNNLGMFEKAALKIIYGGLPPASLREAINCYEKARAYEPDFALNFLELAKAYHRNGQDDKAKECLRRLPAIPNKTGDDAHIKSEGVRLLREWE
ncbi:MAG: tetratricopeptide repeat protein [Chitinophagaceae bacterium]|nr:MAG: tetratricopeptide repeat protein [Chitinophagaceae bacterium]